MTDEKVLEILVDFGNALEVAVVNMKRQIAEVVGVAPTTAVVADFNKLPWETKQGTKGEYGQTSKRSTNNNDIFKVLQAKLREHNGFWQYQGFKFWFHQQDQDVIDRRKS